MTALGATGAVGQRPGMGRDGRTRLVATLLALAVFAAGLVHAVATPLPAALRNPALAAIVALGGGPADICGHDEEDGGPRHCEACLLAAPALPPAPGRAFRARRIPEPLRRAADRPAPRGATSVRANRPRAPPSP